MSEHEEVRRIAKLARIKILDSEMESLVTKFKAVLDHFKFLEDAQTEGVVPLFHAAEKMELRDDIPESPLVQEDLLRNAPDSFENCFKIPRVLGSAE